jgi:hypothetical protein
MVASLELRQLEVGGVRAQASKECQPKVDLRPGA